MVNKISADTRLWAVMLVFILLITAALCSSLPVSAADESIVIQTVSVTSSADGVSASVSAENEKSMDPFSFIFGFLVPVGAVVTFLIFFIVTRTARLKKRHAEAKRRLSDGETSDGAASDT